MSKPNSIHTIPDYSSDSDSVYRPVSTVEGPSVSLVPSSLEAQSLSGTRITSEELTVGDSELVDGALKLLKDDASLAVKEWRTGLQHALYTSYRQNETFLKHTWEPVCQRVIRYRQQVLPKESPEEVEELFGATPVLRGTKLETFGYNNIVGMIEKQIELLVKSDFIEDVPQPVRKWFFW
jgi:hypothetical protein